MRCKYPVSTKNIHPLVFAFIDDPYPKRLTGSCQTVIFEFSFVFCLLACKEKLFLHYLFIFFMYLFKSVWTHGSLILIYRLLSLFILMLRFTQIWPVGAKRKKCFLRDPAGKRFDKRGEKVHP